jgi:mannose-1-phosphate guanylyltransferase
MGMILTGQGDDRRITPVILSGRSGSGRWPLSRSSYPKQFLVLPSDFTIIQGAALRVASLNG